MDQGMWKHAARPLPRRRFLQIAGLGAGAVSAAGLLAACGSDSKDTQGAKQATAAPAATTGGAASAGTPAQAASQAAAKLSGKMSILMWSHFVPAYDKWVDQYAKDWGKQNGVEVTVDHIPHLELPARYAAEIAAKSGHDLVQFAGSGGGSAHIYPKQLENLDDICGRLEKEKGGYVDFAKNLSYDNGNWKSFPDFWIRFPILYRQDLWEEVGYKNGPDTWDDILEGGRKLKAKGNPGGFGMANHTDSLSSTHALLYSFGGKIVEADGKTIVLDSKETRDALRFGKALYDEVMPQDVLAWDDNSNNTLLASGKGSWIANPISASLSIRNGNNMDLYNKIGIANTPKGPAGRRTVVAPVSFGIWQFAKNKDASRAFLNYFGDTWLEGYKVSESYNEPFLGSYKKEAFDNIVPKLPDPKINVLKDFTEFGVMHGWPGPMTPADEEQWQSYVLPTMFAKVARGTSPDDAIKEAVAQIKKIYEKWNS